MTTTHLAERLDGDQVEIEGDAYRHLFRSKRLAVGDSLRVVDGFGHARRGVVSSVDRRHAVLHLGAALDANEPNHRVHLVVGAPKPERAGWLVEKATEIGVDRITFIATQRTPREYGGNRLERFARIATSAVEQCGRSWRPPIAGVVPWRHVLDSPRAESAMVLAPGANPLTERCGGTGTTTEVWVGPEGGFTGDEQATLARHGVAAAGLGPSILRVETAALAAAALLLCR